MSAEELDRPKLHMDENTKEVVSIEATLVRNYEISIYALWKLSAAWILELSNLLNFYHATRIICYESNYFFNLTLQLVSAVPQKPLSEIGRRTVLGIKKNTSKEVITFLIEDKSSTPLQFYMTRPKWSS